MNKELNISMFLSVIIHIILLLISSIMVVETRGIYRVAFTEVTLVGVSALGESLGQKKVEKTKSAARQKGIVNIPKAKNIEKEIITIREKFPIGIEEVSLPAETKITEPGIGNEPGKFGVPWGNPNVKGVIAQRGIRTKIVPEYPQWARKKGVEGEITVEIIVAPSGIVKKVTVVNKSGYKELDQIVVDAVKKWIFDPLPSLIKQEDQVGIIPFKFVLTK